MLFTVIDKDELDEKQKIIASLSSQIEENENEIASLSLQLREKDKEIDDLKRSSRGNCYNLTQYIQY